MLAVPIYQISRVQQAFAVEKANLGHLHSPENEIFNICKISFNKRYLLHTYILLHTIATFQKAGTCLEAQQSMAKQPIKGCVSNHSRTCGESVSEKSE